MRLSTGASYAQFEADLSAHVFETDRDLDAFVRALGIRVFEEVSPGGKYSPGTPVDKGHARNSWAAGINEEPSFSQQPTNPDPEATVPFTALSTATAVLGGARFGDDILLASNCAYIDKLENGHSEQAPTGMVGLAVANAQPIVDEVAREHGAT